MASTLKALQLAQKIASSAPKRVVEKSSAASSAATNNGSGGGASGFSSLSAASATQPQNQIQYQVPEALKHIPPFLFQCVPMDKLVKQQPYLDFPDWCVKPPSTHAAAHFEVKRPDPQSQCNAPPSPSSSSSWVRVTSFNISKFPFYLVGNSESICDFRIDHPSVSRVHLAVVHHKQGKVCICDMHSSNGTFLNGRQIEKGVYVPIAEGDQVRLGGSSRTLFLMLKEDPEEKARREEEEKAAEAAARVREEEEEEKEAAAAKKRKQHDDDEQEEKQRVADAQSSRRRQREEQEGDTISSGSDDSAKTQKYVRKEADRVMLHHLLIKHKDVENPVSKAPRNKGEQITRSAADAEATANMIRSLLVFGSAELTPEQREEDRQHLVRGSPQVLEGAGKFFEAVAQHSECATAKKNGLMGEISKQKPLGLPQFEEVALHLVPLEVSRVVKTNLGMHLLFRIE